MSEYAIEMLNITKRFPGIVANDHITLQLKKGEIHALLGENGAGKSLMSILFGLYQPEEGEIRKNEKKVEIKNPNDVNALEIGMVHQHFKLVECFSVLDNIILGVEPTSHGLLRKDNARKKVMELSEKYHLQVDPDALVENITVGMQQRTEILKMLYRDNEILIFDEPTAVLTVQEIAELMRIMKGLAAEEMSEILLERIHSAKIPQMVVTMGGKGAVYADENGQKGVYPALKVDVVDTTGAGDAFFAGVCIGLTYGKSLREACGIGTRLASTVICTSENICPRFMPEEFGLAR